jgi:hypothetical protein|tara:strand:+ start:878 stop:1381 length:504 start_codon:yes stop_codon:yes gene_type:complete
MIKKITSLLFLLSATCAWAVNSPISGLVQANCSIYTTTGGQYGNPSPWKLSTASADGGVDAIIRVDIAAADYYNTKFTHPNSFSTAPSLTDGVTWTGSTVVSSHSVSGMSVYEAAKVVVSNTTTYNMTLAGSTWFKVASTAAYGSADNTALPAGNYTAMIVAECIAK